MQEDDALGSCWIFLLCYRFWLFFFVPLSVYAGSRGFAVLGQGGGGLEVAESASGTQEQGTYSPEIRVLRGQGAPIT